MTPAPLRVRFEKRADGDAIMHCTRADGTSTGQRHAGARGTFFVYHDLTHLAVERTLGLREGFFGLIAAGWDIPDTEGRGARGALPPRAAEIENLVGLFDRERAGSAVWSAADINAAAAMYASTHGRAAPVPLTDAQVAAIRSAIDALHAEWRAVQPGDAVEIVFAVTADRE